MTLATYLNRAYCAQNKIKDRSADTVEDVATVTDAFRAAANGDADLLAAAKAERDRLKGVPPNRCHISKTHGAFLTSALEGL